MHGGVETADIGSRRAGHQPTFRREASSNAIAVANSDCGEPSMPTSTGPARYGRSTGLLMDYCDGTMRVMDEPRTHRAQQATA